MGYREEAAKVPAVDGGVVVTAGSVDGGQQLEPALAPACVALLVGKERGGQGDVCW